MAELENGSKIRDFRRCSPVVLSLYIVLNITLFSNLYLNQQYICRRCSYIQENIVNYQKAHHLAVSEPQILVSDNTRIWQVGNFGGILR